MSRRQRWFDGVTMPRLVLGTVAAWFVVVVGINEVLSPRFDEVERTTVAGEVVGFGVIDDRDGVNYDILLRGHPVRFRIWSEIVHDAMMEPLGSIPAGTVASLVVSRESLDSPTKPPIDPVPTVAVDAMALNGRTVLDLAVSRRWHDRNRRIATWMVPLFLGLAALCSTALVCRIRRYRVAEGTC
jgi:hypothetical protein